MGDTYNIGKATVVGRNARFIEAERPTDVPEHPDAGLAIGDPPANAHEADAKPGPGTASSACRSVSHLSRP